METHYDYFQGRIGRIQAEGLAEVKKAVELITKGDVGQIEKLLRSLEDEHYPVRRAAVKALGRLGDACACLPLIKLWGRCYTLPVVFWKSLITREQNLITSLNFPNLNWATINSRSTIILSLMRFTDKLCIALPLMIFPFLVFILSFLDKIIFDKLFNNIDFFSIFFHVLSFVGVIVIVYFLILFPIRNVLFYMSISAFYYLNYDKFSSPNHFWRYIISQGKLTVFGQPVVRRLINVVGDNIGNNRALQRKIEKALSQIVRRSKEMRPAPLCTNCLARYGEFRERVRAWRRLNLFGCRRCHEAGNRLNGMRKVVVVLDRSREASTAPSANNNGVLCLNWFAANGKRAADLDELQVGVLRPGDVNLFLIDWAEAQGGFFWDCLKATPVKLLPGAQVDNMNLLHLKEHFASVGPATAAPPCS